MSPSTIKMMIPSSNDSWWWISMIPLLFIVVFTFVDVDPQVHPVAPTPANTSWSLSHAFNSSSFLCTDNIEKPPSSSPSSSPWSFSPVASCQFRATASKTQSTLVSLCRNSTSFSKTQNHAFSSCRAHCYAGGCVDFAALRSARHCSPHAGPLLILPVDPNLCFAFPTSLHQVDFSPS